MAKRRHRRKINEALAFVQAAATPQAAMPVGVELFDRADDTWIDAAIAVRATSGEAADVFRVHHRAARVSATWALVHEGTEVLACGSSKAERGWSSLLGIYVRKDARRRGFARAITVALLSWGFAQGAKQTWLQGEQENSAAWSLYQTLGFCTVYAYHHWVQATFHGNDKART